MKLKTPSTVLDVRLRGFGLVLMMLVSLSTMGCGDDEAPPQNPLPSLDAGMDTRPQPEMSLCGNGTLDPGEICDGDCPTSCDNEPLPMCATDLVLEGSAANCDARCEPQVISVCTDGDGCCPEECTRVDDSDCRPDSGQCGNGTLDEGESCDPRIDVGMTGSCPLQCPQDRDGDACTVNTLVGMASMCSVECMRETIAMCSVVPDGCCPATCTTATDPDCAQDPCGNGVLDTGEICDPAIGDGEVGSCPRMCDDADACTSEQLTGSADECTAQCETERVTMCTNDDTCCPANCGDDTDNDCSGPATCGNGVLDTNEACDFGIGAGSPGACPQMCVDSDGDACTPETLVGTAALCTAECKVSATITACTPGDGCCPTGCEMATDDDCASTEMCGNGMLEMGETCDPGISAGMQGACPAACDDGDACTQDVLVGSPVMCTAACQTTPISACVDADSCCPMGCNNTNDSDCPRVNLCGNGTLDMGESCDPAIAAGSPGACPTQCDDGNACTMDQLEGNAMACTASCRSTTITTCTSGDSCCVAGCNAINDSDCSADCSNGVLEPGEACDPGIAAGSPGACPTQCDDGNSCTSDALSGSALMCTATCQSAPITACISGDSCCPLGCARPQDTDCPELGSDIGQGCTTNAQCVDVGSNPGVCLTAEDGSEFPGGYCASGCQSQADCPTDAECADDPNDATPPICFKSCQNSTDCRMDYTCQVLGTDNVCLPDPLNPSGAVPGSPCTRNLDCQGTPAGFGFCSTEDRTGWESGYCSSLCDSSADCPGATRCSQAGLCVATCQFDSDCRTGYVCRDFYGEGQDMCAPATNSSNEVGANCVSNDQCIGNQLDAFCVEQAEFAWPSGYCSASCRDRLDCPNGSFCWNVAGVCIDACTSNGDCRTGYECFDEAGVGRRGCYPVATGTGAVGAACDSYTQCAGGRSGRCQKGNFQNGYCLTTGCASGGTTCQAGAAHCSSSLDACLDSCIDSTECRTPGYLCQDVDDDGQNECWPAATGTGAVGTACDGIFQCTGDENGTCLETAGAGPQEIAFDDGYCSIDCSTEGTAGVCPSGSTCIFNSLCLDTCTSTNDCRANYNCASADGQNVCFPN